MQILRHDWATNEIIEMLHKLAESVEVNMVFRPLSGGNFFRVAQFRVSQKLWDVNSFGTVNINRNSERTVLAILDDLRTTL